MTRVKKEVHDLVQHGPTPSFNVVVFVDIDTMAVFRETILHETATHGLWEINQINIEAETRRKLLG